MQDEDTLESAKISDKSTLFLVMGSARAGRMSAQKTAWVKRDPCTSCRRLEQVKGASTASGGTEAKAMLASVFGT